MHLFQISEKGGKAGTKSFSLKPFFSLRTGFDAGQ